jgi:hypothetical protein
LEFRQRTIDRFALVFDAENESNDNAIASNDFAEKWGWFGVMHRLCNQDISKLENITTLGLIECLTWLSYETELNLQNKIRLNERTQ